jgi:hypothetical protein
VHAEEHQWDCKGGAGMPCVLLLKPLYVRGMLLCHWWSSTLWVLSTGVTAMHACMHSQVMHAPSRSKRVTTCIASAILLYCSLKKLTQPTRHPQAAHKLSQCTGPTCSACVQRATCCCALSSCCLIAAPSLSLLASALRCSAACLVRCFCLMSAALASASAAVCAFCASARRS